MIKINIELLETPSEYPVLLRGKRTGIIVAFTGPTSGVVIQSGSSQLKPFTKHNDFCSVHSGRWIVLSEREKIILSN